jgi:Protein of unknown function (DUF1016).
MDEESVFFPDLLFYHIPQRRYVIVELKTVKFAPEFAGKLNFYEWSLKDINKPLGIATYQLQEVVERTIAEIEEANKKK